MARSSECTGYYAHKVLDNAGIVREAMLRQQPRKQESVSLTGLVLGLKY